MTEVLFYHLERASLEKTLPGLLQRCLERGWRAVVEVGNEERMRDLDSHLWSHDDASFLPHGTAAGGNAAEQPIYLTVDEENPNDATLLVLTDGAEPGFLGALERCLDLFDGNDAAAVEAARGRWKRFKDADHDLTYWQQAEQGGWEKKG